MDVFRSVLMFILMLILGAVSFNQMPIGFFIGLILIFLREPATSRWVLFSGLALGTLLSYGISIG